MLRNNRQQAFTLVEILLVVGIIGMLSAIAIPNVLSAKRTANESAAKSNLRSLAGAAETASISLGRYPTTVAEFGNFIAVAGNYCLDLAGAQVAVQGYNYGCVMNAAGYTISATPVTMGTTGSVTYTVTTGCVLTPL